MGTEDDDSVSIAVRYERGAERGGVEGLGTEDDDSVSIAGPAVTQVAPAVATVGLSKRYGDHTVVDRVTMTVPAGRVYGFLGPNGAGKTTTLRMLVGLVAPTTGTATVLGGTPGDPAIARRVGVLIEGPGFYPYLSGRDNLRVLAKYRGLGCADVSEALHRVGLSDRADDRFRAYSLGMKQRLGVGAALLGNPDLLILDEPTNGLDPSGMADMRELVVGLAADGHTVLLSSHLLAEVQQICDRVGVIAGGRLLAESTVAELRGQATLFIDAAPRARAVTVLGGIVGVDRVSLNPDGIRVDVGRSEAPRLVRELVQADVDVLQLRVDERSLEEVFFDMTTPGGPARDYSGERETTMTAGELDAATQEAR
jgi:ABC-2 type transport system ATP-binding protein